MHSIAAAPSFRTSETEYQKLQTACPGDFPWTYKEFCQRTEAEIRYAASVGVHVAPVSITASEFLASFAASNGGDRCQKPETPASGG